MHTECFWRPNSGCHQSEAVYGVFQPWWQFCERQVIFWMATQSCHTMKWRASRSTHLHELSGNCIGSRILASTCWEQYWQCRNITNFAPGGSHECSRWKRKNNIWKFVRNCWTNTAVSWITSLSTDFQELKQSTLTAIS